MKIFFYSDNSRLIIKYVLKQFQLEIVSRFSGSPTLKKFWSRPCLQFFELKLEIMNQKLFNICHICNAKPFSDFMNR
jgi:hypothetical protein